MNFYQIFGIAKNLKKCDNKQRAFYLVITTVKHNANDYIISIIIIRYKHIYILVIMRYKRIFILNIYDIISIAEDLIRQNFANFFRTILCIDNFSNPQNFYITYFFI